MPNFLCTLVIFALQNVRKVTKVGQKNWVISDDSSKDLVFGVLGVGRQYR